MRMTMPTVTMTVCRLSSAEYSSFANRYSRLIKTQLQWGKERCCSTLSLQVIITPIVLFDEIIATTTTEMMMLFPAASHPLPLTHPFVVRPQPPSTHADNDATTNSIYFVALHRAVFCS